MSHGRKTPFRQFYNRNDNQLDKSKLSVIMETLFNQNLPLNQNGVTLAFLRCQQVRQVFYGRILKSFWFWLIKYYWWDIIMKEETYIIRQTSQVFQDRLLPLMMSSVIQDKTFWRISFNIFFLNNVENSFWNTALPKSTVDTCLVISVTVVGYLSRNQ